MITIWQIGLKCVATLNSDGSREVSLLSLNTPYKSFEHTTLRISQRILLENTSPWQDIEMPGSQFQKKRLNCQEKMVVSLLPLKFNIDTQKDAMFERLKTGSLHRNE